MKVAWIGLGHMGIPMASNLVKAGVELRGFDLSPNALKMAAEQNVPVSESLSDAVEGAEIVITMLPKGSHVRTVLVDSHIKDLAPGATCIDCSTINPMDSRALADELKIEGLGFVDAPVSGGTGGAQAGTLTFMIGGTGAQYELARTVLKAAGENFIHAGPTGCGHVAKIVNNMMLSMNMASVSEGAILAERLGIDARTFCDIASVSSGDSWVLRNFYPVKGVMESSPVEREFQPGFRAELMHKDVRLAIEAAAANDVPVRMAEKSEQYLSSLMAVGQGELDLSAVVKVVTGEVEFDDRKI